MTDTRVQQGMGRLRVPFLPRFLTDTEASKPLYVLKAWLLTFLPSVVLANLVTSQIRNPDTPEFGATGSTLLVMLAVVAPVLETLIMLPPLLLLNRFAGPIPAILVSSAGWGIAHATQGLVWGLVAWWPFLIFSTMILAWKERSLWTGVAIVMIVHSFQNAIAGSAMLLEGG